MLTLQKLSADPRHGSGTTNVKLTYGPLLQLDGGAKVPAESIKNTIDIVNHRGKRHIPLHVGFVGSNTILNDGTPNHLTLRITNTLPSGSITFNRDSKFILGFDAAILWAYSRLPLDQ